MYELKHNLILPDLRAALPYTPSQELIFIAGGRPPAKNWLTELAGQNKKGGTNRPVWAIDRGVNICRASALSPACLIGDGDSADKAAWTWATERGARVYRYPPEKDFTDTELALNIAVQNISCPLVILTAGFGGRLDHLISTAAVAAPCFRFLCPRGRTGSPFLSSCRRIFWQSNAQVPPCAIFPSSFLRGVHWRIDHGALLGVDRWPASRIVPHLQSVTCLLLIIPKKLLLFPPAAASLESISVI